MEHLEGDTLAQRLGRGALPFDQVLRLAIEIAGALAHAHRQGVVHRDLKPANIMLTKAGGKLLDFGIAALQGEMPASRAFDQTLTEEGTILGTFQYMAPEQLEAKPIDARADIFALGAIVYEMATGEQAFKGTSQACIVAAVLERRPELLLTSPLQSEPAMSGSSGRRQPMPWLLNQIVSRCLAKNPDERFQTASDLEQALKWVAERGPAEGPAVPEAGWRRLRTWRAVWVGAGAVALLLAAIAGVNLVRNRSGTGRSTQGSIGSPSLRLRTAPLVRRRRRSHCRQTAGRSRSPRRANMAFWGCGFSRSIRSNPETWRPARTPVNFSGRATVVPSDSQRRRRDTG